MSVEVKLTEAIDGVFFSGVSAPPNRRCFHLITQRTFRFHAGDQDRIFFRIYGDG
jgi:hypothetical protein